MVSRAFTKLRNNEAGVLLLAALVILCFLSVLGLSLTTYLFSQTMSLTLELDRLKAIYLAEAGLAMAINELRTENDRDYNGLGNVKPAPLGGGFFSAEHHMASSSIIGIGDYNKIKRRVMIKYVSL